jgi:hypothetical protein
LSAGMIVAGWDARDGGSVYALPLGGTLVKVPFSIGAPVSTTHRVELQGHLPPSLPLLHRWRPLQIHGMGTLF